MQKNNIPSPRIKRLIICGIPCPESPWKLLFPEEDNVEQKIVTFHEIFSENYGKKDFLDLVRGAQGIIDKFKPSVIIMHDLGVSFGLMAMLRILKSNAEVNVNKIVIFNGAFRGFNVFKSTHPLRIQMMSYESFEAEVKNSGGEVDARLREYYADICHLYRQISYSSASNLVSGIFGGKKTRQIDLGCEMLVIASRNDPYIAFDCLSRLEKDFSNCQLIAADYRHFPYSGDREAIRDLVTSFQSSPPHGFIKSKL